MITCLEMMGHILSGPQSRHRPVSHLRLESSSVGITNGQNVGLVLKRGMNCRGSYDRTIPTMRIGFQENQNRLSQKPEQEDRTVRDVRVE